MGPPSRASRGRASASYLRLSPPCWKARQAALVYKARVKSWSCEGGRICPLFRYEAAAPAAPLLPYLPLQRTRCSLGKTDKSSLLAVPGVLGFAALGYQAQYQSPCPARRGFITGTSWEFRVCNPVLFHVLQLPCVTAHLSCIAVAAPVILPSHGQPTFTAQCYESATGRRAKAKSRRAIKSAKMFTFSTIIVNFHWFSPLKGSYKQY